MDAGWTDNASPFHAGEHALQARAGLREDMEQFGRRVIRGYLPAQHREFYEGLAYLYAGSVDAEGRPWASMVAGAPGFVRAPSERSLAINALPHPGDPLADNLADGQPIGLLGLDLSNRRRNRVNGRVSARDDRGFTIDVDQAFGNCPKYIRVREVSGTRGVTAEAVGVTRGTTLTDKLTDMIAAAETFFIATINPLEGATGGADVSHRGGKPGFVRVQDGAVLSFPDFAGNGHFNTFGNLALCDRAGLLFTDFDSGDVLQLTGRAEVIWDGEELEAFEGAERLVRLELDAYVFSAGALDLTFANDEASPFLDATGDWDSVNARAATLELRIANIVDESANVRSFYLENISCGPLPAFQPGQFLPITLYPEDSEQPAHRTYSLSAMSNASTYRISVKREPEGLVSRHLHDTLEVGDSITARAPRGDFVLDTGSDRPVVLLSAGVGITPMMSMLETLAAEAPERPVWFVHGARNGADLSFAQSITAITKEQQNVHAHIRLSQPEAGDGDRADSVGRVDVDLLRGVLPFGDYEFYLCGPGGFVASLYESLRGLDVSEERIHYEFFGPSSLNRDDGLAPATEPVEVRFAKSDLVVTWEPDSGSLLDLAENAGLSPEFGCRSGGCGSCSTLKHSGAVASANGAAPCIGDDQVLICSAVPASDREALVLNL